MKNSVFMNAGNYLGSLSSRSVSLASKPQGESRYQYATEQTSSCLSNSPYGERPICCNVTGYPYQSISDPIYATGKGHALEDNHH